MEEKHFFVAIAAICYMVTVAAIVSYFGKTFESGLITGAIAGVFGIITPVKAKAE